MHRRAALAAPALLLAAALPARAQSWPARPIRMVIPWTPGQATDLVGRIVAERISGPLGQPIIAENRAGAGGTIGTDAVAKSPPDGHTLLAASTGPIVTAPLVGRVPYEVDRDLAPIAMAGLSPYLLVVRGNFPAQNLGEFIARLRREPGRFSFATSGVGSTSHVVTELFNARARVEGTHVPFAGSGPAMTQLVAGHVDYAIETVAATQALVRQGTLRALGSSLLNGTSLMPEVAPFAQTAGLEGFDAYAWNGFMAPAGTPRPILDRLDQEIGRALTAPEARERFVTAGVELRHRTLAQFGEDLRRQRESFAEAVRRANIRIES